MAWCVLGSAQHTPCPDPISPNRASLISDTSFPLRPRTTRGDSETSQVSPEDVHACLGSSTPRGRPGPHPVGPARVAFDLIDGLGTPELKYFGAQWPRPHAPQPTLHLLPRGDRRTARGGSWLVRPCSQRTFTSSLLPVGQVVIEIVMPVAC